MLRGYGRRNGRRVEGGAVGREGGGGGGGAVVLLAIVDDIPLGKELVLIVAVRLVLEGLVVLLEARELVRLESDVLGTAILGVAVGGEGSNLVVGKGEIGMRVVVVDAEGASVTRRRKRKSRSFCV